MRPYYPDFTDGYSGRTQKIPPFGIVYTESMNRDSSFGIHHSAFGIVYEAYLDGEVPVILQAVLR